MSKSDAGKGDDIRKGFDFSKYWTNFSLISGELPNKAVKIKTKNGKTTYKFK